MAAVEETVALPAFRSAALSYAPDIAGFDPGSPGGLLGLDFHLSADGPKLIEINTNPGGALLNVLLGRAQRLCVSGNSVPPTDLAKAEQRLVEVMQDEWNFQRGSTPLRSILVVDESPSAQYLYPEFLLYQELFKRYGYDAATCAPSDLILKDGAVYAGEMRVDLIYNRLTDFSLREASNATLRSAYVLKQVALSPHPRAHALYADKRNLCLLSDPQFLQSLHLSPDIVQSLMSGVPKTVQLTRDNRDELWANRRNLFFKPASGFGSRASYRGDKLTRKVWEFMATEPYVAQAIVPPGERRINATENPLKVDIRCYAYGGKPLLYAARMYRGQTTNFRTSGGGFAPVMSAA